MIENLQREDLNPIEEANGYRVLMADFGMNQMIRLTASSVWRTERPSSTTRCARFRCCPASGRERRGRQKAV